MTAPPPDASPGSLDDPTPPAAILLAAGKGTRMGGDRPKVLHPVAGRPMLAWVIDACRAVACDPIVLVVGYKAEDVRSAIGDADDLAYVLQDSQLGTGHAAQMARPIFDSRPPTDTLVLAGDGPLIRPQTLARLLEAHRRRHADATLATSEIDDPAGYGRVVRDPDGRFHAIVEHKDANPDQLAIREINPSYYCFNSAALFATLDAVSNANASGEYYLTDAPGLLKRQGRRVEIVEAVPPADVLSINTPQQLAEVDRLLRARQSRAAGTYPRLTPAPSDAS